MRPLVALTCYVEPASWGAWRDVPAVLVPAAYVAALRSAGAQPVLVPPEELLLTPPPNEAVLPLMVELVRTVTLFRE